MAKNQAGQKQASPADAFREMKGLFKNFGGADIETYERSTEYGNMQACKHVLNGKTYVHTEMISTQLESVGELLIESDIFNAVRMEGGSVMIDPGLVISHLIQKKLLRRFFSILLTDEEGKPVPETAFVSKGSEFIAFTKEVVGAFFTLNPNALKDIGMFLTAVFGTATMGGQLIAMALAGRNSFGQPANTGQTPGA